MSVVSLTTARGDALTAALKENPAHRPWDVYPRPQMVRAHWINLNGWWDYCAEGHYTETPRFDRRILVPFPPESSLSGVGVRAPEGTWHYYRTRFTVESVCEDKRLLLHCGGADQFAAIRLNGQWIGAGYPLLDGELVEELSYLQPGENELMIAVQDNLGELTHPYGKQRLRPGGMWYTPVSGIWQTVWLEWVPRNAIAAIRITPDLEQAELCVQTYDEETGGERPAPAGFVRFAGQEIPLREGKAVLRPAQPRCWTPEDPWLYNFSVTCGEDRVSSYFALRTVSCEEVDGIPRLLLNGAPYFFHGLLDQGYWPDGLWTPADPACYEDDLKAVKALGFHMVRKHIKVEPELFYAACDRLGIVVFQDMVNNGRYRFFRDTLLPTLGLQRLPQLLRRPHLLRRYVFAQHMKTTVRRLYNHPCVLYWTIFNEGWGQNRGTEMYQKLKQLDATRIVDTASGWFRCSRTDVDSRHVYFRPFRLPKSKKPVVLSEFGGYVWKAEGHCFCPEKTYGYRIFKSRDSWQTALERLYREQIVPAVERGLCGAVYTQLSDVEEETNGILTYDRRLCKMKKPIMIDSRQPDMIKYPVNN